MDAHQAQQAIEQVNRYLNSRGWEDISLVTDTEGDDILDWLLSYEGPLTEEVPRGDWDSQLTPDQPPEDFHEELLEKAEEAMEAGWRPYDWGMLPDSLWSPERQFGLTSSFDMAGYLTPDGNLLDLSEGAGFRMLDHRSVGSTKAMQELISSGTIRIMPESGYLDIRAEPTEAQYRKIAQYANQRRRQGKGLTASLAKGLGEYDESRNFYMEDPGTAIREYEPFYTPAQIVADIRGFYSRPAEAWARRNCRFSNAVASLDVIRDARGDVSAGKMRSPAQAWVTGNCRFASKWTYDELMRWYEPLEQSALQNPEAMREVNESGRLSERTIRRLFDTDEGQTNFFYRTFNDRPEVARRRQEVAREEREREEQAKRDDYYYHVLPARSLESVLRHGLKPGQPAIMENYSDYSRGKLFLTEKGGVPFWKWRVQDHYGYQTEEYEAPVAVVRVRKSDVPDVSADETGTEDARIESYYVASPIPPDKLEVA